MDEKFAYQRNRETNGAFQKHLHHHQTIQRNTEMLFANGARFPFTTRVPSVIVCLMSSLRRVETESCFLRKLYASLPWSWAQLDLYACYTQKFALTRSWYRIAFLSFGTPSECRCVRGTFQPGIKCLGDIPVRGTFQTLTSVGALTMNSTPRDISEMTARAGALRALLMRRSTRWWVSSSAPLVSGNCKEGYGIRA